MYVPRHYQEEDPELLLRLMRQYSFATLVTVGEDGAPFATHLPFLIEKDAQGHTFLRAHMAKPNPQWRAFSAERDVLVIFQGPHGYVSPTWYATAPQVPTWNYATVHAYGRPHILGSPAEVLRILRDSAGVYESGNAQPWTPEDAEDLVRRLMGGIVAFEVRVSRLEGKFKLSQNRIPEDRQRVITGLERSAFAGDRELAALMREREQ